MAEVLALREKALLSCIALPTTAVSLHASLANTMALTEMQQQAEHRGAAAERWYLAQQHEGSSGAGALPEESR